MLNFLIESHTSSSVEKLEDFMPFTLWPSILVSDLVVVCNASPYVILLVMLIFFYFVLYEKALLKLHL